MLMMTLMGCLAFGAGQPFFVGQRQLSVAGDRLLADGQAIEGLGVMWHAGEVTADQDEAWYKGNFRRMKEAGFSFVGLERGWNALEPEQGKFDFNPQGFEDVIRWAGEEGLWVTILLTPHYTPGWVMEAFGDVGIKDAEGNPTNGSFLNFSPFSPAVEAQIAFQRAALEHYSAWPNVMAVFLTNEQGWGQGAWGDYSDWAKAAWEHWRAEQGLAPTALPREGEAGWEEFLHFRRQGFVDYLNRLYEGATAGRRRFVPVAHKLVFYPASDAFANRWGLRYSPLQLKGDLLAADAYPGAELTRAGERAFGLPIIYAELNFPASPEGPEAKGQCFSLALDHYFAGIGLQQLYAWNVKGQDFPWGLQRTEGELNEAGEGYAAAAKFLAELPEGASDLRTGQVALVIPERDFSLRADRYWIYQHRMTEVAGAARSLGFDPIWVYSGDLKPTQYPYSSPEGQGLNLTRAPVIFCLDDAGREVAYEFGDLEQLTREGHLVVFEARSGADFPEWTGLRLRRGEGTDPKIQLEGAEATSTALDAQGWVEAEGQSICLATYEATGQPALVARQVGKGLVVAAGFRLSGLLATDKGKRLLASLAARAGANPLVSEPIAFAAMRSGYVYLRAEAPWEGSLNLPALVVAGKQQVYSREGALLSPVAEGESLKLAAGELALIELLPSEGSNPK